MKLKIFRVPLNASVNEKKVEVMLLDGKLQGSVTLGEGTVFTVG